MPSSKSPLSEKHHVFQPCTFSLLRHHMSSIISVCQTFIFQISQISNRSQTQSAPWLPITIGYSRWQVLFQALSFPLPPSGSEGCTWEAQRATLGRMWHEQLHSRDIEKRSASTATLPSSQGDTQHSSECLTGSKVVFSKEWKSPIFFLPSSQCFLPQWPVTDESPS